MTKGPSTWVGSLDLDDDRPAAGVLGPPRADHCQARVLVRMHRAPLGFVWVAAAPQETLTARVRTAAQTTLAQSLSRHAQWDSSASEPDAEAQWAAQVACPQRFPDHGAGVSVVICTRDRTAGLRESLRTLQRVSYHPLEILVVDNAPTGDATKAFVTALARDDPRVRYTCEPRPGLSRARNHGLTRARFDLVAFTDDDILIDPDWPAAIAAGFAADPEAVCVTGLLISGSLDTSSERYFDARYGWGDVFEPRRYDLTAHRQPSGLYPFRAGIFGTGANFAVRHSALAPVGNFDPLLGAGAPGRGGEDLDMLLRIILANGRICYLPSALVWHLYGEETRPLREQIYSYGHGLGAYLAKHVPNRDLQTALIRHGLRQVGVVLGRAQRAAQVSHLETGSKRLMLTEARGVLAGALHYWRAAHQVTESSAGVR